MPPRSGRKLGKASTLKQRRARAAAKSQGRDDRSDYKNRRRAEKIEAAEKKSGCAPKLGMFILPFVIAGAYLILT